MAQPELEKFIPTPSEPVGTALHDEMVQFKTLDLKTSAKDLPLSNLILVDAAEKAEGDKAAAPDDKKQDKDILKYLISLPPEKLGPGLNLARDAAKELSLESDAKQAAARFVPKFEAAVKQTDQDYVDTVASQWGDLSLARRDVSFKASSFMTKVQGLNANLKEVPEEKREKLATMINLMQNDDLSPALAAELRKSVGEYPDVLKSFDIAKAAEVNLKKATEAVQKAQEPLLKAAGEQAASRYVMAQVLEMSGKSSDAFMLKQKALEQYNKTTGDIIGQPVAPKPLLQA